MIITKNKNIELEYYNNDYSVAATIHIASVTKSIISILIGIAIDKGAIKILIKKF